MAPSRDKPVTRRTMLSQRDALTAEARAEASARIADRAAALVAELPPDSTIALYAPKGSEVATARLDEALRPRARIVYPRVVDLTRELAFHAAAPSELATARFGLREPAADPATTVELATISAFFVPGLAFDRTGGRVGWGRGHYDATLAAAARALHVGLAFECQLVAAVPHDPHDVRLHFVVTELDTYRTPD
ncbi:MAG TPA: 5-formyltetrahydrofolate cyclo-ligase [Kofleriaceae bacterium]